MKFDVIGCEHTYSATTCFAIRTILHQISVISVYSVCTGVLHDGLTP